MEVIECVTVYLYSESGDKYAYTFGSNADPVDAMHSVISQCSEELAYLYVDGIFTQGMDAARALSWENKFCQAWNEAKEEALGLEDWQYDFV